MFNKNDPLIGAVQEVMKRNQLERDAAKAVNEKFGIHDRKALPHEKQGAWDAAYKQVLSEGLHPNQEKLDVNKNKKLDSQDFKMLRKKKPMEEEAIEESDETSPSSMGIKKPDYASGTPDYAKPKEQTVNRAEKTSAPAGTVKPAAPAAKLNDTGRAGVPGTGNRLAKPAAPAAKPAAPKPVAKPATKQAAKPAAKAPRPAAAKPMRPSVAKKAGPRLQTRNQRDSAVVGPGGRLG